MMLLLLILLLLLLMLMLIIFNMDVKFTVVADQPERLAKTDSKKLRIIGMLPFSQYSPIKSFLQRHSNVSSSYFGTQVPPF